MATPLSFTRERSVRYPAPDVARGFMLLLIALANVGVWASVPGPRTFNSSIDGPLTLLRVAFVDQRAYPLFAVLFGYGLMMMVKRSRRSFVAAAAERMQVPTEVVGLTALINPAEVFHREATVSARRLLRRRGWWMLLFGAIHGMLFPGDIIGTYAIIALVFAGVIASENTRTFLIVGAIFGFFSFAGTLLGSIAVSVDPSLATALHGGLPLDPVWYAPLRNLGMWFLVAVGGAISSMAVLGVSVGAYLATTTYISDPDQHRGTLEMTAAIGLLVAFLASLPYGLVESELMNVSLQWWMAPLNQLAGLAGALGWLALLTLFAGPAPMLGRLTGSRWVLAAVGRRSMTSYVAQSVLFAAVFLPMFDRGLQVSEFAGVLIAVGVWLLTVALAVVLEFFGKQGPLEYLLRRLVLRREVRLPEVPVSAQVFAVQDPSVQMGATGAVPPPVAPALGVPAQGLPASGVPAQGVSSQPLPAQTAPAQGVLPQASPYQGFSTAPAPDSRDESDPGLPFRM